MLYARDTSLYVLRPQLPEKCIEWHVGRYLVDHLIHLTLCVSFPYLSDHMRK